MIRSFRPIFRTNHLMRRRLFTPCGFNLNVFSGEVTTQKEIITQWGRPLNGKQFNVVPTCEKIGKNFNKALNDLMPLSIMHPCCKKEKVPEFITLLCQLNKFSKLDYLLATLQLDVNSQDEFGKTALMKVINEIDDPSQLTRSVKLILSRGADVGIMDKNSYDALCYALLKDDYITELIINKINPHNNYCTRVTSNITPRMLIKKWDTTKLLINLGANVNSQDSNGYTALINAIKFELFDIAYILIEQGANLNIKDNLGRSALSHACEIANNLKMFDLIKKMIQHGAEKHIHDKNGMMPYDYARENEHDYAIFALYLDEMKENIHDIVEHFYRPSKKYD